MPQDHPSASGACLAAPAPLGPGAYVKPTMCQMMNHRRAPSRSQSYRIVSNYFYWEQIICGLSGFGRFPDSDLPLKRGSRFRSASAVSGFTSVSAAFPLSLLSPSQSLSLPSSLRVSLLPPPHPRILSSTLLSILLSSSLLQSRIEGINQPQCSD